MGADYPVGIWGKATTRSIGKRAPAAHKDYIDRVKAYTKEDHLRPGRSPAMSPCRFLVEAIKKANSTDGDKVAKALLDLTVDTPIGKQTIRAKDHQANRGQLWGKMVKDPKYPFAVMTDILYIDPEPFMD